MNLHRILFSDFYGFVDFNASACVLMTPRCKKTATQLQFKVKARLL